MRGNSNAAVELPIRLEHHERGERSIIQHIIIDLFHFIHLFRLVDVLVILLDASFGIGAAIGGIRVYTLTMIENE